MSAEGYLPLPITVDEITPEWLTAALRTRASGATVRGCEMLDVVNATTTRCRVKLDLDEAARRAGIPEVVIVKGGFQAHSRELAHMHLREVVGYRDVYPSAPLNHPACYFADFDPERRQGIIIMEDLAARGVEFCHATRPQAHEEIAARLSVLARFHAVTWGSPELAPGGKWGRLVDFFEDLREHFAKYTLPENWRRLITSPRGVATSARFHDSDWMIESWNRVASFGQTLPYCVLHGDVHLGNLYVEADGTPGFVDTMTARGPAMLEVSYYLSASIDLADRRRWEGALVRHYLDELARNGVQPPGFDEAMRQYAIFLLYGHFVWISTEAHYQVEAVNTANAARVSAAMLDNDTIGLIAAL